MGYDGRKTTMPQAEGPHGDELALEGQLCFALCPANSRLVRIYGKALEPLGLTVPQCLVLMALWEASPRPVGQLAQVLNLDKGSITPLLKRLEARGFLTRVRDKVDERRVFVHITDKGHAVKEPVLTLRRAVIAAIGVPQSEIDLLIASPQRFSPQLQQNRIRFKAAIDVSPGASSAAA